MNLFFRTVEVLKQRRALLLWLAVLAVGFTAQAVTISATGKVTQGTAWELVAVSPLIAGDEPSLSMSGSLVSPPDATTITVYRPELSGGYGKERKFRISVSRTDGMALSLRWSTEMQVIWDPTSQQGVISTTYIGYLELSDPNTSYDFVDIVFKPRGEGVTFFVQYSVDANDLDMVSNTLITFTVIDLGEVQ
ncbi:hypothetical protein EU77_13915 [Mesotoga sp. SC_NapDC]|nr:hypothetical protein EU77_13915 [Mesotoga sp. SC_NapDC]